MNKDIKQEDIEKILRLPFRKFVDLCVEWKEVTHPDISKMKPEDCPIHRYSLIKGRCMTTVAGTELCLVCGNPMCPKCGNHCVTQLSRVTGYLSAVSNWNAAKKQEFKDRQRHDMGAIVGVAKR